MAAKENEELRVSLLQYDIAWEDKLTNISYISNIIDDIATTTDLVVLPEMFSTGFSSNAIAMAETMEGETLHIIKELAKKHNIAICGSLIIKESSKYYNRAFFITSTSCTFYDKRHLFRMGHEADVYTSGNMKKIVNYKGFNICLLVCYDLRFPVWSRNVDNEYDLLIYVANWPESRKAVWNTLLQARAIENMSFVCGVNRIGKDNNGLNHSGNSMIISPRGDKIKELDENKESSITVTINKETLIRDRAHFPVWKDTDKFEIIN